MMLSAVGCSSSGSAYDRLTVSFLKVGKADAIILDIGGRAVIIDAGEDDDGEEIAEYLEDRKISQVDALIITHFDKDHIGGADTLLRSVPVGRVILPDYEGGGSEYRDLIKAVEAAGISPIRVSEPMDLSLGQAHITIDPPDSYDIPKGDDDFDNDMSLMISVTHGNRRMLFAGDAESARLDQWLAGDSAGRYDLLKVPHHGVYDDALPRFFSAVGMKYAVICSSKKNPADSKTLSALRSCGAQVFQTKDGNITAVSDGEKITVSQEP